MDVGIGLECPQGHFKVQIMIGEPKCPICGRELIPDKEAPDTAMNRRCDHCGTYIALGLMDTGNCPNCEKPFD